MREIGARFQASLTPGERAQGGLSDGAMNAAINTLISPWYRWFLRYDPNAGADLEHAAIREKHEERLGVGRVLLTDIRLDVETAVGFIQNGDLRVQHGELEDLDFFLLAAGEAFVQ